MTVQKLIALAALLQGHRLVYADEKVCQDQIEAILFAKGIDYRREYRLGDAGICDFYFPNSRIVLEAKAFKSWSKLKVYRQCERYCRRPEVAGLLLATGKAQGLPTVIAEKPVRVHQLGLGAL